MSQTVTNEHRADTEVGGVERSSPRSEITPGRKPIPVRLFAAARRVFPTLLVLLGVAALGYWGHHTGWEVPKFSELTGDAVEEEVDWCTEHGVPESICIACNADLMPKGRLYGWCREHGVAECVLDHPELAQLKKPPVVSQADLERARRALALKPRPENDPTCKLHLRRIQFASAAAAEKAGIEIALVDRAPIEEVVSANGEVVYDPTRVARLSSRAGGTVWSVETNVGQPVHAGDLVALVDAAPVGRAKAELLQAVAQLDVTTKAYRRLANLESQGIVAAARLQETEAARAEAEAAVRKAVQTLVNLGLPVAFDDVKGKSGEELAEMLPFLGLPRELARRLDPRSTSANLIPVISPRDGIVVWRDVVAGEVVDAGQTLFIVADTSQMWLLLDVPLEDVQYVREGQTVRFQPDGSTQQYIGTITWISTEVDAQTRTVKVRAELSNRDGHLRNESFGAGRIVLRQEDDAIVVPREAIHWEGCCHVAFVRDKNYLKEGSYKVFHTRMVRPGVTNGDMTEVIAGLLPGEVVVTTGSAVLRAELLKGSLGAG